MEYGENFMFAISADALNFVGMKMRRLGEFLVQDIGSRALQQKLIRLKEQVVADSVLDQIGK